MTRVHAGLLLLSTCLVASCGRDGGGPPASVATVSGTVTSAASGAQVAGATVSIGSAQATSDANGHFELSGVRTGAAVEIECARPGFQAYSATIAVEEGSNSHDIALTAQELYTFTDFVLYVPAGIPKVRGVIVALGGPDTRAFVDGRPSGTGVDPDLEAALQTLGGQLRALARDSGLVVVGSGQANYPDAAATDALVLSALQSAATASGRAELSSAPLIMLGFSAGAAEAFGLTERQATRTAAFALTVPVRLNTSLAVSSRAVPGFLALHENDSQVDIPLTTQQFLGNRANGALWSLSVEPELVHGALSDEGRTALVNWITTAVGVRLPATVGGALRSVEESSGWLGNQTTFDIASYATYAGDKQQASWLPTSATASDWRGIALP